MHCAVLNLSHVRLGFLLPLLQVRLGFQNHSVNVAQRRRVTLADSEMVQALEQLQRMYKRTLFRSRYVLAKYYK